MHFSRAAYRQTNLHSFKYYQFIIDTPALTVIGGHSFDGGVRPSVQEHTKQTND